MAVVCMANFCYENHYLKKNFASTKCEKYDEYRFESL